MPMVRVRVVVAVVVLASLVALVSARPTAAVQIPLGPEPLVAMGDSFTAGEGSPPFEAGTEDGCRRSQAAYPRLVALWRTTNLACGGATAVTVVETGQHGEPPQLGQLPVDARRVVMTLGGNDIGFGEIILSCVVLADCTTVQAPPVSERLTTLSAVLPAVYRGVLDRAVEAHLYVLEYPVLLPAVPVEGCLRLAGVSAGEQVWGRQVNLDLNRTIRHAVDAVAADHPGRITFVPTADRFAGHAVCDSGLDWIRGLHPLRAYSFHPNYAGQVGLALALRSAMTT